MTIFSRCDSIIKLSKANALLAQLDRASGYGPEGQGFESLTARHSATGYPLWRFFCSETVYAREKGGNAVGWWVYMLECRDGTLYTGCTDDIPRRLAAHNSGRGAKYTRGRGPVTLRYCEGAMDKPAALRREAALKRLSRVEKLRLIRESRVDAKGPIGEK